MKKILTLAVAAVTAMGLTMSASSLSTRNSGKQTDKKEQTVGKEKKGPRADRKAPRQNQGQRFNPFEGLNLTDQQKAQLKELAPKKGDKACQGKDKDAKCDSTACCKFNPDQAKQFAIDRLAKIKAILTPDQYQQYLENVAIGQMMQHGKGLRPGMKDKMKAKMKGKGGKNKDGKAKDGRKGKGQRPDGKTGATEQKS